MSDISAAGCLIAAGVEDAAVVGAGRCSKEWCFRPHSLQLLRLEQVPTAWLAERQL